MRSRRSKRDRVDDRRAGRRRLQPRRDGDGDGDHGNRPRRPDADLHVCLEGRHRHEQPVSGAAEHSPGPRQIADRRPLRLRRESEHAKSVDELAEHRDAEHHELREWGRHVVHGGGLRFQPLGSLPADRVVVQLGEPCDPRRQVPHDLDALYRVQSCHRLRLPRLAERRPAGQCQRCVGWCLPAPGHDLPQEQHSNLGGQETMKRLHRMAGDERGFALVLALGITVVLSMTVVTVVESTTANSRASVQSKNRVSAYNLAEAGVNNASAILRNASNSYDPHVLHPQPPNQPTDCASPPASPAGSPLLGNTCSPLVFNLDGRTATVSGVFDSSSTNWTVSSTGQTRNPYGGQATTRTLTAIIHIRAQAAQNNVVPAWNYVFVKDTTPNVCNVTLDQTTALTASLYTEGNLCFKNQASISETNAADPVSLEVRGKLVWLSGASKGVGQSSPLQQISSAKIGGGCATGAVTNTAHTCTTSSPYHH